MKPQDLQSQLHTFLAVRSAVGFKDKALGLMLNDFVKYITTLNIDKIQAKHAIDWACNSTASQACRLSAVRKFLTHLSVSYPEVQIPQTNLVASFRRKQPYIFSKQEIIDLLEAAINLRPRGSLRRHTYNTLIGLMATTGLRVSEAIKLRLSDVALRSRPARINIEKTKFYKSRIVPVHSSTATHLRQYVKLRYEMGYAGLSDAFFVSEKGKQLGYQTLRDWFHRTIQRLGIMPTTGSRPPTLHSFRHTFAVERLTEWCKEGLCVFR